MRLTEQYNECPDVPINDRIKTMKIGGIIYLLFLTIMFSFVVAGCGGGSKWVQCSPCDDGCRDEPVVNVPTLEAL